MKKFAFLAVLLALSTVALGVPRIEVMACPPAPDTDDSVNLIVCGCAPGNYYLTGVDLTVCCGEQYLIVDVYMDKASPHTMIDQPFCTGVPLGQMCPGMYMVVARLHLKGYNGRCMPDVVALDSTFFTVEEEGGGCGGPLWWPF